MRINDDASGEVAIVRVLDLLKLAANPLCLPPVRRFRRLAPPRPGMIGVEASSFQISGKLR